MQDQILGAEGQGPLDLAAKRHHALLAEVLGLAADVNQIASMNDERPDFVLRTKFLHSLALTRIRLGRAPHARARGKDLQGIGADLFGALHGVRCSARRAQMHSNALCHRESVYRPSYTSFISSGSQRTMDFFSILRLLSSAAPAAR